MEDKTQKQDPTQNPPQQMPKENSMEPKKSSKLPLLIIVLLLVLLIPLGGYFLLNESNKAKVSPTPTQTVVVDNQKPATTTKTPTPMSDKMALDKSFTSVKFDSLSFSGYSLQYPSDWTLSEQRDGSVPISTVTLTKSGYTLKIYQAATGGAQCIYEGSMPEGPASDYTKAKFVDLTSFATLRQTEAPSNGKMAYAYCQKNAQDGSFGQPTSVGHMSVTTNVATADPKVLSEIESIVESIELVK